MNNDLNKLHQYQLALLKEINRICKKYNIDYFLAGGTLIGAVRHKGFIPWDDDIDIGMTRDNYDKFKKIVLKELNNNYFFQDYNNDLDYGLLHGKVRIKDTILIEESSKNVKARNGIYIDILPFDNIVISDEKTINNIINLRDILLIRKKYEVKFGTLRILFLKIKYLFMNDKKVINKINVLINKYKNIDSDFVINYSSKKIIKIKKEWINDVILIDFAGYKYPCPKNYDSLLKQVYGNYMEIPSLDKRLNHNIIKLEFKK